MIIPKLGNVNEEEEKQAVEKGVKEWPEKKRKVLIPLVRPPADSMKSLCDVVWKTI